ncbi:MAG: ADP-ribose pyrophosphatase [Parcubacteria group bacterium GW2011_GWA1_50_14]|nr:MAG: ADP-ribose pyrophosphatase [Parcubacteria group bacterium GW2011_GWA1_50_14]
MELQVGVKILLNNEEGKYLLLRRSKKKYPEVMDIWDIPGGRIDPGVSLLENLKREMREEIELELKMEPKLIAAQDIMRIPGRHVVRLTYLGTIEGRPTLDAEENDEYKWFSREELGSLDGFDRYLKELIDGKQI